MADVFLDPRPAGMEILHGPAGRRVNSAINLSFGTSAQNSADMERDGTTLKGTAVYIAKLTEDIVRTCRIRYAAGGVTVQLLADEFGVSMQTMWDAIHRRTWKHVNA